MDELGRVGAQRHSDQGMNGLDSAGFEAVLGAHVAAVAAELGRDLAAVPVVMCGMVGARTGWREAPYLPVPATLSDIAAHATEIVFRGGQNCILPGLMRVGPDQPNVMRGEETQLFGLSMAAPGLDGVVCMPGTHSKWVILRDGVVEDFYTAMTGEVFALLSSQSTLRHALAGSGAWDEAAPAFVAGAQAGLAAPEDLLLQIFTIRAASLVAGQSPEDAAARLSGMLIGAELGAALRRRQAQTINLVASGTLAALYGTVFALAGQPVQLWDAAALSKQGLLQAARERRGR